MQIPFIFITILWRYDHKYQYVVLLFGYMLISTFQFWSRNHVNMYNIGSTVMASLPHFLSPVDVFGCRNFLPRHLLGKDLGRAGCHGAPGLRWFVSTFCCSWHWTRNVFDGLRWPSCRNHRFFTYNRKGVSAGCRHSRLVIILKYHYNKWNLFSQLLRDEIEVVLKCMVNK